METEFRKLRFEDAQEIGDYKREFQERNSGMDGTGILFRSSPEEWLMSVEMAENSTDPNGIRCLQYGLFEKEKNRLLGTVQARLELKGYLVEFGGHIGYCVRPSERRKGYAKQMLKAVLDICRKEGLERVLITCLKENVGSARTIESCGGVFERSVYDDLNYKAEMLRYWIAL